MVLGVVCASSSRDQPTGSETFLRRGYQLALAELRTLLFVLLRNFRFHPAPGKTIEQWYAVKAQPVVLEEKDRGAQLPLIVTALA